MTWLYILVGLLTVLIVGVIQYYRKVKLRNSLWAFILTLVFTLSMTNLYGVSYYQAWAFESNLKKESPLFTLLAQKSPASFQEYISKAKRDIIYHHSKNIIYYTSDFISSELMRYTPHATNSSLYNEVKVTVDYYNKIYAIDPLLVLFSEFPDKFANQIAVSTLERVPKNYFTLLFNAKKNIIQSALENPQPAISSQEMGQAQTALKEIFEFLINKYGEQMVESTFQTPDAPSLNRQLEAQILMEFYQQLLKRGEIDAGLVLKYIASTS